MLSSDFIGSLSGVCSACSPNVARFEVALSGGTDTGVFCEVQIGIPSPTALFHTFRLVNKSFDGTVGEFYIDLTEILPYFFTDISDDELTSGSQEVVDTFKIYDNALVQGFRLFVYDSGGVELDSSVASPLSLLFSSKQIGEPHGSNEVDIASGFMPNFLAQKNKISYVYFYGSGTITFEKVEGLPEKYAMIDNAAAVMVDNDGNAMINEY
jgi:hypothetical protein